VLAAVGYFTGTHGDPFAAVKHDELAGSNAGLARARHLLAAGEASSVGQRLPFLIHACLWGNRVDLSNFEMDEGMRGRLHEQDRDALLIDHTDALAAALAASRSVHVLLDNAGSELVADLLLADLLLDESSGGNRRVTLHAKHFPFFVSDAMPADIRGTIDAFAADGDARCAAAGRRLGGHLVSGRLAISDHWLWSSAEHFRALPEDCARDLARADIVLVKGDANYRRLLEDRKWDTGCSLEEICADFPAPFACLRTMKSEIVVDIPPERAASLEKEDPAWLVNGRRGLIRLCRR
jgi:uncharacterized protein with ATP-grasp and redox domains